MQTCREREGERGRASYMCVCVLWHFLEFLSSPRFAACCCCCCNLALCFSGHKTTHTHIDRQAQPVCACVCVYLLCTHTPPTCCTAIASHMSLRFHCQYCAYAVLSFLSFIFCIFVLLSCFFIYCFFYYIYIML